MGLLVSSMNHVCKGSGILIGDYGTFANVVECRRVEGDRTLGDIQTHTALDPSGLLGFLPGTGCGGKWVRQMWQ